MNYVLLLLGILILLVAIMDLAYTTFSPHGAGKIANFISQGSWKVSLKLCGNNGTNKTLQVVGIITIWLIIFAWVFLIWLGSSLIVSSAEGSVVGAETGLPATLAEKFYYTGFTLSTLGVGDFVAGTDGWRIFSVVLSLTGFLLITTAISYMLPVLAADVQKKSISRYIICLGTTPEEILKNHWIDGNFKALEPHITELMNMIIVHSQQLLAYPILYCFHNSDPFESTAINIAKLDEALSILLVQVSNNVQPDHRVLMPLRKAITAFIIMQKNYFLEEEKGGFSVPELRALQQSDIPLLRQGQEVTEKYSHLEKRRKLISAILNNEGWRFDQIYEGSPAGISEWDLREGAFPKEGAA
ncbi:hypothetical protein BH24BAC1_BH24BAC1_29360 [soil metagenome]